MSSAWCRLTYGNGNQSYLFNRNQDVGANSTYTWNGTLNPVTPVEVVKVEYGYSCGEWSSFSGVSTSVTCADDVEIITE